MKLVSYKTENMEHLGVYHNHHIYNLNSLNHVIPDNMSEFLQGGEALMEAAHRVYHNLIVDSSSAKEEVFYELMAPVTHPTSFRDVYAFKEHLETRKENMSLEMMPDFYEFPVFYFSNHNAIQGPGDVCCMPDHLQQLDFELEIAAVINKKGKNIEAAEADDYIAGFMIMNDMSARNIQNQEMRLGLGPVKGKDFATVIGPWLVTPDELEPYKGIAADGHIGQVYNLEMKCLVNGKLVSSGNMNTMHWTFAEIIERCSYGCDLLPGDIIGSGNIGTECLSELNKSGSANNPNYDPQWLKEGDIVEMQVSGLGILTNTIVKENSHAPVYV